MNLFNKIDTKLVYHLNSLNYYDPGIPLKPWDVHRKDWYHFFAATFWFVCLTAALIWNYATADRNR